MINVRSRNLFTFAWTSVFLFCSLPLTVQAQSTSKVSVDEAKQIAVDAYIYGYSLITTNVTQVQMTIVPAVEAFQGPIKTGGARRAPFAGDTPHELIGSRSNDMRAVCADKLRYLPQAGLDTRNNVGIDSIGKAGQDPSDEILKNLLYLSSCKLHLESSPQIKREQKCSERAPSLVVKG